MDGLALSNTYKAAVATMVHPPGEDYGFTEDDTREWSWLEMLAQLNEESIKYVVEDVTAVAVWSAATSGCGQTRMITNGTCKTLAKARRCGHGISS